VPTGDGRKTQLEASVKLAAAKLDIDLDKVRAMYAEVGSGPKGAPTKLPKGQALLNSRCYSWTGNMPATPASDGTHVIVRIASENSWGYLVCYDLDGNRKWSVDTGRTADWGCPYDSPLIIDGKAISLTKKPGDKTKSVQLSAFDIETGKPLWSLPTRANCASPVGLRLEGVPLICHDGSVYATADGAVLGSMKMQGAQKLSTFCSPSIDGDLILNTIAGRNAVPVIHRLSWTEKGKAIAYEEVFRGINGDGGGMPFSWDRGSPVLSDGWIFKSNSKSDPAPVLFAYNSKVPFQQSEARKCNIRGTNPVRPRPKKGEVAPLFGPPSEDDMSMVMGGQYLYAAPSHWPSQFVVVSAPPELKVVGEPVMDAALMGSPYFQGNRIYMRDYRYLYCFGEVPAVDQAPKGVN
jgi:hypothetical protein